MIPAWARGLDRAALAAATVASLGLVAGSPVLLAWAASTLVVGVGLWLSLPGPGPFLRWLLGSGLAAGSLQLAALEGALEPVQAAASCLIGGAWLALILGALAWRDPAGLLLRAGEEPDARSRERLLRRVLALRPGDARACQLLTRLRPARPEALPGEEEALLRHLEELTRPGAHLDLSAPPPATLRARARAALLQGTGAALLPGLLLAWPLVWHLGPLDGGLVLHALAAALATWGARAVLGERLSARVLAGAPQGVAVGLGLAAGSLGAALLIARLVGLVQGQDAAHPGQALLDSGQRVLGALPGDRLAAVLFVLAGLLAPAACWAAQAQGPSPRLRGRSPWSRWLTTRDLAAPWVIALATVLVLDELALTIWITTRPPLGWGSAAAAMVSALSPLLVTGHLILVALAWAGLALLDPRPHAGRQRTPADERRRVVAAIVALRAARAGDGAGA